MRLLVCSCSFGFRYGVEAGRYKLPQHTGGISPAGRFKSKSWPSRSSSMPFAGNSRRAASCSLDPCPGQALDQRCMTVAARLSQCPAQSPLPDPPVTRQSGPLGWISNLGTPALTSRQACCREKRRMTAIKHGDFTIHYPIPVVPFQPGARTPIKQEASDRGNINSLFLRDNRPPCCSHWTPWATFLPPCPNRCGPK